MINRIYNEDCMETIGKIADKSIDLMLTDPPYNTTTCDWEYAIDFELMWKEWNRIIKPGGVFVFTGTQPFTSILVMSNIKNFKEEIIWQKDRASNFANAKYRHLKYHENIIVFANGTYTYNKQMQPRESKRVKQMIANNNKEFRTIRDRNEVSFKTEYKPRSFKCYSEIEKNPMSVLYNPIVNSSSNEKLDHPTQKPIDLFRYLIKTFSNEGETVFDGYMGTGTTAEACIIEKRNFIGSELNKEYFELAQARINNRITKPELW